MGSMASRAGIERFLLLCSASHRFLSNPHASVGMTWEADLCCFSVVTGLWSHVIQAFGSNRPLKPCRPGVRFKQAFEAMSSPRGAVRWHGIYGFKGRHRKGFLLLCSTSHRFLSHPHASAGMTWEADLCCFSVVTGLWSHVVQALGSNRPLKPCHPSVRFKRSFGASI